MRGMMVGACALALAGCALVESPAPSVTGRWYSEGAQGAEWVQTLVTRHADGTFAADFRATLACGQPRAQHEEGVWTLAGATYTTVTRAIDGASADLSRPDLTDVYTLDALEEGALQMRHARTGTLFSAVRVTDDFAFPPPEPCRRG